MTEGVNHSPRILLLTDRDSDTGRSLVSGFTELGCPVNQVPRESLERPLSRQECDVVVAYGPHNGSMMPVFHALSAVDAGERPYFLWCLYENAPVLSVPSWLANLQGKARFLTDRLIKQRPFRGLQRFGFLGSGHRARILGELCQFSRASLVQQVAVGFRPRQSFLQRLGIPTVFAPMPYYNGYGRDLAIKRDIDVLYLGSKGCRRRDRLLCRIEQQLGMHGVQLTLETGSSHRVVGQQRVELLNRTRILLNVMKSSYDMTFQRFLLGMANKALVVSEPFLDAAPFTPGEHFVQATPGRLSETILWYLQHPAEREHIIEDAYRFVRSECAAAKTCERLLADYFAGKGASGAASIGRVADLPATCDATTRG